MSKLRVDLERDEWLEVLEALHFREQSVKRSVRSSRPTYSNGHSEAKIKSLDNIRRSINERLTK